MMVHFGLATKCFFCNKPLLAEKDVVASDGKLHIAGKTAPLPIKTKMTIHHGDGEHANNKEYNRKPSHQRCHKSYELKFRHQQAKLAPRGEKK